ncbi:DUF2877 domain-containing protein [Miltoncostaea marina]|uniref:oxamate carbamoyltransferase subunit AllH family protein n=1 Tax=Miltoncostaea marina TaxID=2843215 RepID=UPI001C3D084B|nr:DUF2877 domain-containing protein [Miltoncostaea marina]
MARRLRGPCALRVLGAGRGAVHLDLRGFVVTLTAPGVPRMPNGIAVAGPLPAAPRVAWDPLAPPLWDPVVPPLAGGPAQVRELAAWLAARTSPPDVGPADAADRLMGRGPGLTPEGDDVLCGAAVGVRALAPAAGLAPERADALVAALLPPSAGRTGALSATLLGLAAGGAAPEPVTRLVAPGAREAALADLRRLGSSTGAALAAGLALAARWLTAPA